MTSECATWYLLIALLGTSVMRMDFDAFLAITQLRRLAQWETDGLALYFHGWLLNHESVSNTYGQEKLKIISQAGDHSFAVAV